MKLLDHKSNYSQLLLLLGKIIDGFRASNLDPREKIHSQHRIIVIIIIVSCCNAQPFEIDEVGSKKGRENVSAA
jgi:hypothetical protein